VVSCERKAYRLMLLGGNMLMATCYGFKNM